MIGDLLRELRLEKGLTQRVLARLSGVTQQTISDIERGRSINPSIDSVVKLASALGVTLDELYKRAGLSDGPAGTKSKQQVEDLGKLIALAQLVERRQLALLVGIAEQMVKQTADSEEAGQ